MKFHVVKFGSRALLAMPANASKLQKSAIDCYPAHTRKKRLIRLVLHVLSRVGLIRYLFPARSMSLPGVGEIDFKGWMGTLCEQLGVREACPVLVWPADPARGRVYLYLLDGEGRGLGFCKLGLDKQNSDLIEHEWQSLIHLQSMELRHSRIPKLLASGDLQGAAYLVAEMTPPGARIVDWRQDSPIDENIEEYAGSSKFIERAEIESLPWWPKVRDKYAQNHAFMNEVDAALTHGLDVCLAHGDLNCTNVLRDGSEVWLLDWEQSDKNAPSLTDQVCVAVDRLWAEHSVDPATNLLKFMQFFPESDKRIMHGKLVMALAYLGSVGFTPAIAIIEAWFPPLSEVE